MNGAMKKLVFVGLVAVLAACGSSNDTGAGGSGTTSSGAGNASSSSSFHCCINASAYECPNKAAFDKCSGGDPQACFDTCSVSDPQCMDQCMAALGNNDPSDCKLVNEPVATYCNKGSGGTGGTGGSGNVDNTGTCSGSPCSSTEDCAQTYVWCNGVTGHCFDIRASCEGNACASEFDCPQGFTCDSTFNTCTAQ